MKNLRRTCTAVVFAIPFCLLTACGGNSLLQDRHQNKVDNLSQLQSALTDQETLTATLSDGSKSKKIKKEKVKIKKVKQKEEKNKRKEDPTSGDFPGADLDEIAD